MIKSLFLIILLAALASSQNIIPYYALPVQTTQNVLTSYSFLFYTDTDITSNAWVAVSFPFEFSASALTQVSRVRYLTTGSLLQNATWSLLNRTFSIRVGQIAIGNITVVVDGVLNPRTDPSAPTPQDTSSYFSVATLFKNVVVTSNTQFARVPFTAAPGKQCPMQSPPPAGP
jgi:hypothetical protein